MRRLMIVACGVAALATPAVAADPRHPTVVELYQSQGCSSCPPANAILNKLANDPNLLPLSFAVTYWDQLGWKDSFGQQAFTDRQWDYARAGGRHNVATPQMIINGRGVVTGGSGAQVIASIRQNDRGVGGPVIVSDGKQAVVRDGRGGGTLWLVRYDPRTIAVPIKAGENGGRTLPHRNIVRQLIPLGAWTGPAHRYTLPASPPNLKTALFVQAGKGGPIVAALRL